MDSVLVDSVLVILGPFRNPPEFRGTEITILAGGTAKIPFCGIPGIDRNRPDSGGFRQEYVEDCKELPGCTILLPSAILTHSNVAITPKEMQYSFTQYTTGSLFQWVENGFQKSADFSASLSEEGLED